MILNRFHLFDFDEFYIIRKVLSRRIQWDIPRNIPVASNQNFGSSGFLFGSNLDETKGFFHSHGVYLGSVFGKNYPIEKLLLESFSL